MVRRKAVLERYAIEDEEEDRVILILLRGSAVTLARDRWPMVRRKAVYSSATRLCGASGTRYMTMRGQ
eukprot:1052055-Prymnesium_polylepis.1